MSTAKISITLKDDDALSSPEVEAIIRQKILEGLEQSDIKTTNDNFNIVYEVSDTSIVATADEIDINESGMKYQLHLLRAGGTLEPLDDEAHIYAIPRSNEALAEHNNRRAMEDAVAKRFIIHINAEPGMIVTDITLWEKDPAPTASPVNLNTVSLAVNENGGIEVSSSRPASFPVTDRSRRPALESEHRKDGDSLEIS